MFAGKKSAQIREILISESAWEEMTCLFAPSLTRLRLIMRLHSNVTGINPRKLPAFPAPLVYPTHSLRKDCRR
ncbi:hypothetical protein DRD00_24200 [Escherichia coli]|nr:hypothetical protein [Escherichia coli]